MNDKTKRYINSDIKGIVQDDSMSILGVVGSTGAIDRQGESLNPKGWDTANYTKNPILLYGHDYKSLPIGKAERVWIENDQLMFDLKFADTPMGKEVFSLIKNKFLNAFSVGFIPLEFGNDGEYTFNKQELLELSVVPVPANPEALSYIKENAPVLYKALKPEKKKEEPEKEEDKDKKEEEEAELEATAEEIEEEKAQKEAKEKEEKEKAEKEAEEKAKAEAEEKAKLEAQQKEGRVLSKANEEALRTAYEAIGKILEAIKEPEEAKEVKEEEKKEEVKESDNELLKRLHGIMKQADKNIGQGNRLIKKLHEQLSAKGGEK